jgi:hypothetical protein
MFRCVGATHQKHAAQRCLPHVMSTFCCNSCAGFTHRECSQWKGEVKLCVLSWQQQQGVLTTHASACPPQPRVPETPFQTHLKSKRPARPPTSTKPPYKDERELKPPTYHQLSDESGKGGLARKKARQRPSWRGIVRVHGQEMSRQKQEHNCQRRSIGSSSGHPWNTRHPWGRTRSCLVHKQAAVL